jgi:hypothetical protein
VAPEMLAPLAPIFARLVLGRGEAVKRKNLSRVREVCARV